MCNVKYSPESDGVDFFLNQNFFWCENKCIWMYFVCKGVICALNCAEKKAL